MFHNYGEVLRTAAKPSSSDEPKTYDCDLCDSGDWLSETEVEIHKKGVHKLKLAKKVVKTANACKTCARSFPKHKTLIEHIKSDHLYSSKNARRVEREIFICEYCSRIYFNKQILRIHIIHRHIRPQLSVKIKCPLCHKKKNSKLIYGHMKQHGLQSVSVCAICLVKQKNTKALSQHMETHLKHYHCNICGYISTREKYFNMHIDMYERRKKRFIIKNFNEYFTKPLGRSRWVYDGLHTGFQGLVIYNNVFICVLCRQICTKPNEMQEHILRDHSSEPETVETVVKKVCSCGEQFSNMILLKHHIFKNKGQHRLSYTELDQSAGEDSSDAELAIDTEDGPEAGAEKEIIYSYVFETAASINQGASIDE